VLQQMFFMSDCCTVGSAFLQVWW